MVLLDLLKLTKGGLAAAEFLVEAAWRHMRALVAPDGEPDPALIDIHQREVHGFAWAATYAAGLRQMHAWATRLDEAGKFGALEQALLHAAFGEYLAQLRGGIAMSQTEIVRPEDLRITVGELCWIVSSSVERLIETGRSSALRQELAALIQPALEGSGFGDPGLDETLLMIRDQFRRFGAVEVEPHAQSWHRDNALIPLPVIEKMAEMGVFGLSVPEEFGGHGLGKLAMAVVSEELSRAYIGVGSLGTRSEIAAELIRLGGTPEQKEYWLPRIASGEIIPTAVFTEPNTGSDLGSLATRAVRDGDVYRVTGAKTWITHASRSDLMTLMVRTDPAETGYRGLSLLLAAKPRGTPEDPFPVEGLTGGEIQVLGYRGMQEFELAFDAFAVPADALLGGIEGRGFKQLMATFESARVQTAARATGVAQNALELGLAYALERVQFGRKLYEFPRVADKLAWMAVETMIARQLTYFAAREKDSDRRCDIEAGMAKLLAARVAWSNADCALQIHGGNGYAQEYPISRVLCDARILSIFEGAAEIQAQVIARGLLGRPYEPEEWNPLGAAGVLSP
ncbi:MAG TPA: acyl-CoA dehydrogenase family protein [Stellaceae bacterium]|nr:acyl-CoA dehydrogenase family protein [Stellaceae bacterium]